VGLSLSADCFVGKKDEYWIRKKCRSIIFGCITGKFATVRKKGGEVGF
jgi:hypothetical protein